MNQWRTDGCSNCRLTAKRLLTSSSSCFVLLCEKNFKIKRSTSHNDNKVVMKCHEDFRRVFVKTYIFCIRLDYFAFAFFKPLKQTGIRKDHCIDLPFEILHVVIQHFYLRGFALLKVRFRFLELSLFFVHHCKIK